MNWILNLKNSKKAFEKLNKIYDDSQKEKPTKDELDVDYGKDFEDMVRKSTGKIIKLINKGKTNYLQIEYADNEELEELMTKIGEPKYRAKQIFTQLHKGILLDEMTNVGKATKEKITAEVDCSFPTVKRKLCSRLDGTVKYLFSLY